MVKTIDTNFVDLDKN